MASYSPEEYDMSVCDSQAIAMANFAVTGCQFDEEAIKATVTRLSKCAPEFKTPLTVNNMCNMLWSFRTNKVFGVLNEGYITCCPQAVTYILKSCNDIKTKKEIKKAAELFIKASSCADAREKRAERLANSKEMRSTPFISTSGLLYIWKPTCDEVFGQIDKIPKGRALRDWVVGNIHFANYASPEIQTFMDTVTKLRDDLEEFYREAGMFSDKLMIWNDAKQLFEAADNIVEFVNKQGPKHGKAKLMPKKCGTSHWGRLTHDDVLAKIKSLEKIPSTVSVVVEEETEELLDNWEDSV